MNRNQKIVLYVEVVLLLIMFNFPPYFGIDRENERQVHAQMGYYPFWSPPSSTDVFQELSEQFPSIRGQEERLESFESGLNKVMLTFNVVISLLVTGFLVFLFRTKKATEPVS
jgi:hypothetical protein